MNIYMVERNMYLSVYISSLCSLYVYVVLEVINTLLILPLQRS